MAKDWKRKSDEEDPSLISIDAKSGSPIQVILSAMMEQNLVSFWGQYHYSLADGRPNLENHWVEYLLTSDESLYFLHLLETTEAFYKMGAML